MNSTQQAEKTPLGTVVDPNWDQTYLALVIDTERNIRKPICAALTGQGMPCKRTPQEKYGWRCGYHRASRIATSSTHGLEIKKAEPLELLKPEVLRAQFQRCASCAIRAACHLFNPDSEGSDPEYCKIEEHLFDEFVREAREFGTAPLDDYMIYEAAMAFIRSVRGNRALANSWIKEEHEFWYRTAWQVTRESKEFRESMKFLGLSRGERLDQDHKARVSDTKLGVAPGHGVSLAEIMSTIQAQLPGAKTQLTMERAELTLEQQKEIQGEPPEFAKRFQEEYSGEFQPVVTTDEIAKQEKIKRIKKGKTPEDDIHASGNVT